MPAASEPWSGSVVASAVSGGRSPQSGRRKRSFCSSLPSSRIGAGEEPARGDERTEAPVAPRELLEDQAVGHQAVDPAAAVGLGEHVRGQPERGGLVHDLELRLDVGIVDRARDRAQLALGELVRERREVALLVADAETDAGHGGPRFELITERLFSLTDGTAPQWPGARGRYAGGMAIASVRTAEAGGGLADAAALGLDRDALLRILRALLLTRRLDERGHVLFKQGKLPGSFYTCKGNEARLHRRRGRDGAPTTSPRLCTATSAFTSTAVSSPGACSASTWAASAGRPTGATRTSAPGRRAGLGILAGPSHLPSILPVAVGAALAFRVRGEPRVALGWVGDGSSANGTTHESMNFAGVRRLPMVFVIDNNQFAYSTPTHLNFASTSLAAAGRPTASRASSSTARTCSRSTARRALRSSGRVRAAARRCSS